MKNALKFPVFPLRLICKSKIIPKFRSLSIKNPRRHSFSLILDFSFSHSTEAIHQQVKVVYLPGMSQTQSFSQLPPTPPGPGSSPGLSISWIIAMRLSQVPSYPLLYQCSSLSNFFNMHKVISLLCLNPSNDFPSHVGIKSKLLFIAHKSDGSCICPPLRNCLFPLPI